MATTVLELLTSALQRSTLNDPEVLVDEPEIVDIVQRRVQELYIAAGIRYPMFFGKVVSPISGANGVWTLPADVLNLSRVEDSNGTEIHVVSIEDMDAEIPPRLIRVGWTLRRPTGDTVPQDGAVLRLYCAPKHPDLDPSAALNAAGNTLDASWRDEHDDILIDDIAFHLASRDGREAEANRLAAEIEARMNTFLAHLDALKAQEVDSRA